MARPHAQHSARQGDVRWPDRYALNGEMLRPENGYPLRAFFPGLGRQRQRQMAAPHQGRRPAVALPQRNGALHRPDARRKMAPVQHGNGREIGHHTPSGGQKLAGAGTKSAGSRGRAAANREGRRLGRRRQELAEATLEEPGARQVPDALSKCRGTGTAGSRCFRAARWTATGYVQPTVEEIGVARGIHPYAFVQHHNGIQSWAVTERGEVSNVIAS